MSKLWLRQETPWTTLSCYTKNSDEKLIGDLHIFYESLWDSDNILGDALRLQRILLNAKLVSPAIGEPRQRLRSDLVEEKGQENHCDVIKRNAAENLHLFFKKSRVFGCPRFSWASSCQHHSGGVNLVQTIFVILVKDSTIAQIKTSWVRDLKPNWSKPKAPAQSNGLASLDCMWISQCFQPQSPQRI